jgi:N-acetylglucosamine kinase-like BadF-type ATPase
MYEGRLPSARLNELAPAVFDAAQAGDSVARSIIDRLATELATMGVALIRRLRLTRMDVDVVLAGGVFNATDPAFYAQLTESIQRVAPKARLVRPSIPPVGGAALIGLDRLSAAGEVPAKVVNRLRAGFAAQSGGAT